MTPIESDNEVVKTGGFAAVEENDAKYHQLTEGLVNEELISR